MGQGGTGGQKLGRERGGGPAAPGWVRHCQASVRRTSSPHLHLPSPQPPTKASASRLAGRIFHPEAPGAHPDLQGQGALRGHREAPRSSAVLWHLPGCWLLENKQANTRLLAPLPTTFASLIAVKQLANGSFMSRRRREMPS